MEISPEKKVWLAPVHSLVLFPARRELMHAADERALSLRRDGDALRFGPHTKHRTSTNRRFAQLTWGVLWLADAAASPRQ